MNHVLIESLEKAFGWDGPGEIGKSFARGSITNPELCARLLTPTRLLDTIMRRPLSFPQLRCFQGGNELHPDAFLTNAVTRRGQNRTLARMDRLAALMRGGCTLVLDELNSYDPTMEIACRALQWWAYEMVQVNTYLTTKESAGFDLHWDDHDVIIVQLSGDKSWEVRGPSRPTPMYRDAEPNREPSEEIVWSGVLRAGDVMHIPRGYWHQATRNAMGSSGHSLHVTFGIVRRTGVDWLSWLGDRSREHLAFRHDLDRWAGSEDRDAQYTSLREVAVDLLSKYDPDLFLETREQERGPARHVSTLGAFGPPREVVCVTEFPPVIRTNEDTVEVLAGGKQMTFARKAASALSRLLSGYPVNVEDVAWETAVDAHALAEGLVEHGVCAEVTEALRSGFIGLMPREVLSLRPG